MRNRDRSRDTGSDVRLVAAAFALLIVAGATAAMVAPAGTQEFGVVSAEFQSPGPRVIPMGESESLTYRVPNSGVLPVVTYLEPGSEGITIHPQELRVGPGETVNATVTLHAPPETGYYRRFLVEHRYLAVLPQPAIRALYQFHPWAPIVVIDALLAVPFYLLTVGLVGTGRLRRRSREDPSRVDRLVSRFT